MNISNTRKNKKIKSGTNNIEKIFKCGCTK